ncbi:uncharacterized protein LOC131150640 [Malania oleifera]|uniref:uncharacterized protein LOC131150640 n=1 Tax=Malania oleifera TaxID=397392 RepID=UPI0025ADCE59|nr:uncharacterized protein LOC131150640 [Malania oleifera]
MPRPGPRPYECVRRAWHSDRHQPIRGTLIQEIFRVVNEIHSSATKKNKEWQDKVPVVVLKAEEIMYSKANSEAEYMDLKTLWDRANDAINTIIRRDESAETEGLLQPCIEAALNLGCMARRPSRSQRNSCTRCYLSPNTREPTSAPLGFAENATGENHKTNPQFMSHKSNFVKPTTVDSTQGLESGNPVKKFRFTTENVPLSRSNRCSPMKTYPASNLCAVYPLYYGNFLETEGCDGFEAPAKFHAKTTEPVEMVVQKNLFCSNIDAPNKSTEEDIRVNFDNPTENDCDLSLRLGPLVEDVGSISSQGGNKFSDRLIQMDKELLFCPRSNTDNRFDSCSVKLSFAGGTSNVEALMRKQKAINH